MVAIFWDMENCNLPSGFSGYIAVDNIREIAQEYGSITLFKTYLDISTQSGRVKLRSQLQTSGVSVTDCPHLGRKEVVDNMLVVDMLTFAMDNPAPNTIILISGDRDYAYAISTLRNRNYRVVLMAPAKPAPHLCLTAQASDCISWEKKVLGKTFPIPPSAPPPASPPLPRPPLVLALPLPDPHSRFSHLLCTVPSAAPVLPPAPSIQTTSSSRPKLSVKLDNISNALDAVLGQQKLISPWKPQSMADLCPGAPSSSNKSVRFVSPSQSRPGGASATPSAPKANVSQKASVASSSGTVSQSPSSYFDQKHQPPLVVLDFAPFKEHIPTFDFSEMTSNSLQKTPALTPQSSSSSLSSEATLVEETPLNPQASPFVPTVTNPVLSNPPPAKFATLVDVMRRHKFSKRTPQFQAKSSELGSVLIKTDKDVYKAAAVTKFGAYVTLAEREGILSREIVDGEEGVALHPEWR